MASIGTPKYITMSQAEAYAAQAGFTNQLVPKGPYSPGTWTQIQTISAIAQAESGLNINAWNPSDPYGGSFGVLQINGSHFHAGGTTKLAALDPQQAFQYAYILSAHGTNFIPWGTFTNGSYKKDVPTNSINTAGSLLPSQGWWTYPYMNDLGTPDPYGGFPKPDLNFQVPDNYPIANILSGTVSGINRPDGTLPPYGATVTIALDKPFNNLATHIAYLHLSTVSVRMGQTVAVGDIIGRNGGNAAAGSQKVPLGVALYSGDYYGADGWQNETKSNILGPLNIVPVIEGLQNGASGGYSPSQTGLSSVFQQDSFFSSLTAQLNTTITLSPTADVAVVFATIDEVMHVINPFSVIASNSNPLEWLGDILYAIFVVDLFALTFRILLMFLGSYICFKVFNQITNAQAAIAGAAQKGADVAKVALAFA